MTRPPIPDRVRCYPFHRPFGAMVVDKRPDGRPVKAAETRPKAWPGEPQWIAVYNCVHTDTLQVAARRLPGAAPYIMPTYPRDTCSAREVVDFQEARAEWEKRVGPEARVIGLVWVESSRFLVLEDFPDSYFYEHGRFAWVLEHPIRFERPLKLEELDIRTPPQSYIYLPGDKLREAIA